MTDRGKFIALASGRVWHLEDPRVEEFDLDDAAIGLAHIVRFTGQARGYSVLTHQMHVADIVVHYGRPDCELEALTHDAHEFAVGDMSTPLKSLCPDYQQIEALNAAVVRHWFGLPAETCEYVKRADRIAGQDEGRVFCPHRAFSGPFSGLPLTTEDPTDAMERWLARVRQAMRERRAA